MSSTRYARNSYIAASLLVIAAVVLAMVLAGHHHATAITDAAAPRASHPRDSSSFHADNATSPQSAANWRNSWISLPESVVSATFIDSFDPVTGEISPVLLQALGVTHAEQEQLEQCLNGFLDEFTAVELRHAVVEDTPPSGHPGGTLLADHFVHLLPCQEEAAPVLEALRARLTEILGGGRAATFFTLTRRMMRSGGREELGVGYSILQPVDRRLGTGDASRPGQFRISKGYDAHSAAEARRWRSFAALLDP